MAHNLFMWYDGRIYDDDNSVVKTSDEANDFILREVI